MPQRRRAHRALPWWRHPSWPLCRSPWAPVNSGYEGELEMRRTTIRMPQPVTSVSWRWIPGGGEDREGKAGVAMNAGRRRVRRSVWRRVRRAGADDVFESMKTGSVCSARRRVRHVATAPAGAQVCESARSFWRVPVRFLDVPCMPRLPKSADQGRDGLDPVGEIPRNDGPPLRSSRSGELSGRRAPRPA